MTETVSMADRLVQRAIKDLAELEGLSPADAGRTLLAALARWFGIPDFKKEDCHGKA